MSRKILIRTSEGLSTIHGDLFTGFIDAYGHKIYEGDRLKATIRHRVNKNTKIHPIIEGVVEYHHTTGQFLMRYTLDNFETTIALNGLYNIIIL